MVISTDTSRLYSAAPRSDSFTKVRQSFENLGKALKSGILSDAQQAFEQLQESVPSQARNNNSPMSAKMEALSQALDSGDLKAAQEAYADVKKAMAQRPPGGAGRSGGPGRPPPDGAGQGAGSTSAAGSSTQTYDVKDVNKDGVVSWREELDYQLKNAGATTASTNGEVDSDRSMINALA